jgi:glycosyltransferase involved in cell wall biosynthesis
LFCYNALKLDTNHPEDAATMNILFLTQVLPYPLDAGPKTRAYYVLRYLAQKHTVTLVSFVRGTDTPAAVGHLAGLCAAVHTVPITRSRVRDVGFLAESLVTNQPFIITRDRSAAMRKVLSELVNGSPAFDAVHADQLWMAPYVEYVHDLAVRKPLRVLDQHNAVFMIFRRLAQGERNPFTRLMAQLEAHKLARYEAALCARFERVVWVTREDYAAVAAEAAAGRPVINSGIIPICIDTAEQGVIERKQPARRVTFLGGLHYPPNAQGVLWFAEHIFPQVLAGAPDAVLTVIGKQPPGALANLRIPPANLEITGYVDDPRPYLQETGVFIVPLLAGGGMRVKILDAWRWGLPMVSTTVGAEGIATTHGADILLADAPDAFAGEVLRLLCDPALNAAIAANGRRSAELRYDWRTIYSAWDAVYA